MSSNPKTHRELTEMSEGFIETSHGKLAFIDTKGPGIPVVMVHANSVCKESFAPQIHALEGVRRAIAFDLPGHGASGNAIDPRRSYSMHGYADALLEALSALGVERFVVVGHSLGGHVALEMIARNANVEGALIFGTPPVTNSIEGLQAGFKPSPEMAYTGNAELTGEQIGMVVELALGKEATREPFFHEAVRRTDGLARQYMLEAAAAGQGSDQRKVAESTSVPLAIVNGENDLVINLDYIDSLVFENVWEAEPIRIADAGHGVHREKANEFNSILLRFADFLTARSTLPIQGM